MSKNQLLEQLERLDETLLTSDFTMGFELEGCIKEDSEIYNEIEYDVYDEDDVDEARLNNIKDYITNRLKHYGDGDLIGSDGCHEDSSVSTDDYGSNDISFEYSSPIIPCKPIWFNAIIKTLYELLEGGVYTNKTCGFHHHLHFKGLTERDMVWIYCNMASEPTLKNDFGKMDGYSLYSDEWASYESIIGLGDALRERDYVEVLSYLGTRKWRVFRIHPQGTLEWRGPRDFMNDGVSDSIKNFYKLFIKLIGKIKTYMDSDKLVGIGTPKDEFFAELEKAVEKAPSKPTLEFLTHDESYDSSKDIKFKTNKKSGLSSNSIKNFLSKCNKNKDILYKCVIKENNMVKNIIGNEKYNFVLSVEDAFYEIIGDAENYDVKTFINKLVSMSCSENIPYILKKCYRSNVLDIVDKEIVYNSIYKIKDMNKLIMSMLNTLVECKFPLNLQVIEKSIFNLCLKIGDINLTQINYYIYNSNTLGDIMSDELKSKLYYWLLKQAILHNLQIKGMYDVKCNDITSIVGKSNLKNTWNSMIVNNINKVGEDLYLFYVGKPSVKDLFNIIKREPSVVEFLSDEQIAELEKYGVYIRK